MATPKSKPKAKKAAAKLKKKPSRDLLREMVGDDIPFVRSGPKGQEAQTDSLQSDAISDELVSVGSEIDRSRIQEYFDGASKAKQDAIVDILTPSVYDDRRPDEEVHDYIKRIYPDRERYKNPDESDEIDVFLERVYGQLGFLDGESFTRAVLRKVDRTAETRLYNWLRDPKNKKEFDNKVPPKKGLATKKAERMTPEDRRAAVTYTATG